MATLRHLLDTCDVVVRTHLEPGERVLAVGRCEDVTERGDIDQAGGAWTYVMVTNRMLRWAPHAELRFETSLELDTVRRVREESMAHRYGIALEHQPIVRRHHVPKHRFLIFEWGNAVASTPFPVTKLAFSRRDTEAARALRDQLAVRGVVSEARS
jgi:hypothetical protein